MISFGLKDQYKDQKGQLKDRKSWLKDQNSQNNDQKSQNNLEYRYFTFANKPILTMPFYIATLKSAVTPINPGI